MPQPPYYAVIFVNQRNTTDEEGYQQTAERMVELAQQQPGYLGVESVRSSSGYGITVSYWESEEAIRNWHDLAEHREAQLNGYAKWYDSFQLQVCKVERAYGFERKA